MTTDTRRLIKAARAARLTPIQLRMAAILLAVNGIENALEFVQLVSAPPIQENQENG